MCLFFFFKQKTAYEIYQCDWSSDVCSSDLVHGATSSQGDKDRIVLLDPLGYLDFLALMAQAKCVFTDSGGIQEETTILGVPCLTMRENTERPVTVEEGTNTLVGYSEDRIMREVQKIMAGKGKTGRIPDLWDGKAATRIVEALC